MSEFSKEQISNVKALLDSARRDGCLDLLVTALRDEPLLSEADSSEFEVLSPQCLAAASMTDASKRRGDDGSLEEPPSSKQRPVLPCETKIKEGGKLFSSRYPFIGGVGQHHLANGKVCQGESYLCRSEQCR